jgi:flagellar motor switch protein FliN/FliY
MSAQAGSKKKVEKYFAAWMSSLASLLSQLTSGSWQSQFARVQDYVPLAGVQITLEGGLQGQQWLGFSAVDLAELLGIFLSEEVGVPAELDPMQREALEELIRQWAGLVASALKPEFGEVRFEAVLNSPGSASGPPGQGLRVSDGTRAIVAQMTLDDTLTGALAEPVAAAAAPVSPVAPPNSSAQVEELLRQGNLELLMDVELGVMLRFGCRQTTLHEVLDLATGAVLELDREIQEPVDLVLNGRVIARGEVVVVDGNYGLRVSEVASPQQRVNSL